MSASSPVNVASHLSALAAREPGRIAVCIPGRSGHGTQLTFRELDIRSGHIARGLNEIGVQRGIRTVLMVRPSFDFFALTFAMFKVGAIPVMIDPGMGVRNLGKCLAEAKPEAFLGIPKAQLARRILGWGRRTIRTTVTTGVRLFGGQYTLRQLQAMGERLGALAIADTREDEAAAILFTSGSTGIAKGVVYTHGIFASQVDYLKSIYGIEDGEVDLCTFPLFALFAPALGMTAIIPEMDPTRPAKANPAKLVDMVNQFQVTNLFGSPAIIDRLGRFGEQHQIKLPTLRRAISAGAPASATVVERFAALLPQDVQLFTPYGATESLPVANIGSTTIVQETRKHTEIGRGVCVGRPVPGMDVRIIPIVDEAIAQFDPATALPPGQVGEIAVSGPVVTAEYFGRPEATSLAKMHDASGRLWHRMGDVGYFDESGRLWFCGRKSHRVVTPDGTLFTDQVEPIFNCVGGVRRTALVGVRRQETTQPVICVEREKGSLERAWPQVEQDLREAGSRFGHTRSIGIFLEHPGSFPVDVRHNSKIFREKLAHWADAQIPKGRP